MMKQHYKSDKESKRDKGIGFGSSDPTPALPEREGVRFVTNESNSIPFERDQKGANETSSLPTGEGWGGVTKPRYITANPYTYPIIKDYRKDLKDHQTEAEYVIWEYLRNKKTGHKIRRQHVIGDFIADFACLSKKVIIEIDGKIHNFQKEQDELRTIRLNKLGYEVIRFMNAEVLNSPYQVAQKIKAFLNNRPDSTSPTPL
jgi:very-short-patch-repair endonuclease